MSTEYVGASYGFCDLSRFAEDYGTVQVPWPSGTQDGDIAYLAVAKPDTLSLVSGGAMPGWELVTEVGSWPGNGYGARVYQRKVADTSGYAYEAVFFGTNETYAACWVGRGGQFQQAFTVWQPAESAGEAVTMEVLGGTRIVVINVGASGLSGGSSGAGGFAAPIEQRLQSAASVGTPIYNGFANVGDGVAPAPGPLTVSSFHGASNGNLLVAFLTPGTTGQAPPCRQYPREDGLGTSSARRIYPQPRSQQGGIRRAGGTYY